MSPMSTCLLASDAHLFRAAHADLCISEHGCSTAKQRLKSAVCKCASAICRRVSEEDLAKCEDKFTKSKLVHSIMRHVAETQHVDLVDLYSAVGWPLYKLYGHAFDAFKMMVLQEQELWDKLSEANAAAERDMAIVTPGVKDALMKNIKRRMTPQPLKIRADLEITCFHYGGVENIKVRLRIPLSQLACSCSRNDPLTASSPL